MVCVVWPCQCFRWSSIQAMRSCHHKIAKVLFCPMTGSMGQLLHPLGASAAVDVSASAQIDAQRNSVPHLQGPPPICCPHLIIYSDIPFLVFVDPFWSICHQFLKGGIPDQFLDAFYRIPPPKFHLLGHHLPVIICWEATYIRPPDVRVSGREREIYSDPLFGKFI
jgi:hypothetical protein